MYLWSNVVVICLPACCIRLFCSLETKQICSKFHCFIATTAEKCMICGHELRMWIFVLGVCCFSRIPEKYYLSRSFLSHSLNYQWSWYDQLVQDPVFLNELNPLCANRTKCPNTLKQFVGNLSTICLSVFDYFVILALKGLRFCVFSNYKETVTGTIQNKEFVKIESWLPRIIINQWKF